MAGINHIRRWVMSQMTKKADDGIMITLPEKNKVDLNVSITMDRLLRNGIDPDAFTNPEQVNNAINMINSRMVNRAIPADSDEGREITERLFGKQKAPVFDLEGNRISEGSGIMGGKQIQPINMTVKERTGGMLKGKYESDKAVKELMDSGQVGKGARGMKKSKKVQDREMFKAANERLTSDVNSIIKNIKSMEPITAMKEASSVIGRKGKYKNLTEEQSKKILQDTEDHIFERYPVEDPEDFATGGIARANFVGGGMGRRGFLKMLAGLGGGIAAAKTGLLKLAGKEPAKQVAKEVVQKSTNTPPPYFFKLAEKIKTMGDDVTAKAATKDREVVTKFKEYELTEDVATGEMTIQRMKVLDDDSGSFYGNPLTEETYMNYKPGLADETTKGKIPPGEYEEGTALIRSDREYAGDVVDESFKISDDVIEEAMSEAPSIKIKKASGGIARMLGE